MVSNLARILSFKESTRLGFQFTITKRLITIAIVIILLIIVNLYIEATRVLIQIVCN